MPDQTIFHPVLGELRWDEVMEWWTATVDCPHIENEQIGVAAEPDLEKHLVLVAAFLDWIRDHYEEFRQTASAELFEYDLVWPENHIENANELDADAFNAAADLVQAELARRLKIKGVNVYGGVLRVWIDTAGSTADHLVQTQLNENHKIVSMQL